MWYETLSIRQVQLRFALLFLRFSDSNDFRDPVFSCPVANSILSEEPMSDGEGSALGPKMWIFQGAGGDSSDSSSNIIHRLLERKLWTFLFKKKDDENE